jgi:DNA-binding response OmpR family regulator
MTILPSRAYVPPRVPSPAAPNPIAPAPDVRPVLLAVVGTPDLHLLPSMPYARVTAHTTADAVRLIESTCPRLLAVDLDLDGVDALELCAAARRAGNLSVLVMTDTPQKVPAALRAGCHAVLLKPLQLNLVSARLGRLCRESARDGGHNGTNRVWPTTSCPACHAARAVSFEYSSHRRMWYACRQCDSVWMGPRQE